MPICRTTALLQSRRGWPSRLVATESDITRICGEMDAEKTVAILALRPTVGDLELAAAWSTGEDEKIVELKASAKRAAEAVYAIIVSDRDAVDEA